MNRFLLLFLLPLALRAQLAPGFSANEARDMIAICNSYTYLELYGTDQAILPKGYNKIYSSDVFAMDNKFQIYTKKKIAVVNFRGSTDKKSSWLENFYSAMIPAKGNIRIGNTDYPYAFLGDTAAAVHAGYTLGLVYLSEELLAQLKALKKAGITDLLITGHSQGGALALLFRSYLNQLSDPGLRFDRIKVYTFAQPMVGNPAFIKGYNQAFCEKGMSFSLINKEDIVPDMPISYNDSTFFRSHVTQLLSADGSFDRRKFVLEGLMNMFSSTMDYTAIKFSKSVSAQIEKETGALVLPEPKPGFNYTQVGNVVQLPAPEYPLVMKDSTLLLNAEFLAENERGEDGHFINKKVYKKNTIAQNHKPYNYYTAVLKKYFPEEYQAVEPKVF